MVPGTVHSTSKCIDMMSTASKITLETITSQSPSLSMVTTLIKEAQITQRMNSHNRPAFETGSPLFYGVVVAGSVIIVILLLCMIGVTILGCRRRGYKCGE